MMTEIINSEGVLTLISYAHTVAKYMSIAYWVFFFFGLTNYLGCGLLKYESPPGFPTTTLVSAILSTFSALAVSVALGCFFETLGDMLLPMGALFLFVLPIVGILIVQDIGYVITSAIFGAPCVIVCTILRRCDLVHFDVSESAAKFVDGALGILAVLVTPILILWASTVISDTIADRRRNAANKKNKHSGSIK